MSNSKKGADYDHVTPALVKSVELVLAAKANNRYSTSSIYTAHNQVFKLNEPQDTCTSCVVLRANNLQKWYKEYAMAQANKGLDVYGEPLPTAEPTTGKAESTTDKTDLQSVYDKYVTEDMPRDEREGIAAIIEKHGADLPEGERALLDGRLKELTTEGQDGDVIALKAKDGSIVNATYNSEAASLVGEDGKSLKPGTYTTDAGDSYAVQPGGKASFKAGEESIL